MMHAPKTWLSAGLGIDDQPAILHRHDAIDLHHAGFDVDAHVGHLNPGRALIDQAFALAAAPRIFSHVGDSLRAEFGAGLQPGHAL
jgi:hypothetical protein